MPQGARENATDLRIVFFDVNVPSPVLDIHLSPVRSVARLPSRLPEVIELRNQSFDRYRDR